MDHLRLFPTHHTLRLLLLFIRCTKIYSISNFVKVSIYSSIPQPRLTAVEFIDQDSPNFKTSFFPNIDPLILKFEWNDGEVQSRNHNGHYVHFFSTLQPAVVTPFYSKYAANFDGLIAPRIVRIATNKARIDIPFPARRNISLVAMVHALSFPNQ